MVQSLEVPAGHSGGTGGGPGRCSRASLASPSRCALALENRGAVPGRSARPSIRRHGNSAGESAAHALQRAGTVRGFGSFAERWTSLTQRVSSAGRAILARERSSASAFPTPTHAPWTVTAAQR